MSNTSQGEGWWQASDLKWYPPESHPEFAHSLPDPPPNYVGVTSTSPDRPTTNGASGRIRSAKKFNAKYFLVAGVLVLYVVSPVDFFPEAILGPLGLPDDVIAVLVVVAATVNRFRELRNQRDLPPTQQLNSTS